MLDYQGIDIHSVNLIDSHIPEVKEEKPKEKAMFTESEEAKTDETLLQLSVSTSLNFSLKASPVASIPGSALVITVPELAPNTFFTL